MIKLTDKDKTLVVPAGLGNFGQSAGSGSGVTPEEAAQIASAVTAEALDEYDTELQVDLEEIRDAVSGNSEDISTLSGSVETLSTSLSAYTTNDTFNAGISGLTEQISGLTSDLSSVTYTLSEQISGVSADVEEVSGKTQEVYDEIFYEDESGDTRSQINDLWDAVDGKQNAFEVADGLQWDERDGALEAKIGKGLWFKGAGEITVHPGSGVTVNVDTGAVDLNIGEGLGFSGNTLVVSGGTGGGPTNYYLDDMSQQELADLYDMLAELTEYDNDSSNIPEIFENYRFFAHTTDVDGQQCVQLFFSNWEEQEGDYQLWIGGMLPTKASYPVNVHRTVAIIYSDGTLQMSDSDLAEINNAANDFQIQIMDITTGEIHADALGEFSNLAKFNRFVFTYTDPNVDNSWCAAPLKYFYRRNESINGEDKLVEYIGCEINILGTWYKGDWKFIEWEWGQTVLPTSWTTV